MREFSQNKLETEENAAGQICITVSDLRGAVFNCSCCSGATAEPSVTNYNNNSRYDGQWNCLGTLTRLFQEQQQGCSRTWHTYMPCSLASLQFPRDTHECSVCSQSIPEADTSFARKMQFSPISVVPYSRAKFQAGMICHRRAAASLSASRRT